MIVSEDRLTSIYSLDSGWWEVERMKDSKKVEEELPQSFNKLFFVLNSTSSNE